MNYYFQKKKKRLKQISKMKQVSHSKVAIADIRILINCQLKMMKKTKTF